MKSSFKSDLLKEKALQPLLDTYYQKLHFYNFKRIHTKTHQLQGVDLYFIHKQTNKTYVIDEKAQLDYIGENLPTFAFEICYLKKGISKQGWFYDASKITEFYALATNIQQDGDKFFTSCKLTLVNRNKLQQLLQKKGITLKSLKEYVKNHSKKYGQLNIPNLNPKKEGYLYASTSNKAEKPLNLILRLSWLIDCKVAKTIS
ncbi:hypothetical protein GCM10011414_05010 [Croceivirga lutea]|uniref:hypothetical protein n=1 Tax=Croceivirga lutea TaxID=1775167 RepID=UPI001639BAD0|nr:hypothetical protein [Croceivirga lutea]GGG38718.1 hypothetical protein GCM10011414_05010 [Croceivirga lutea]